MVNVRTLTTGYDFPALDRIIDGATTMSAALHYQKCGRLWRPYDKKPEHHDLAGNINRLGDPVFYTIERDSVGRYEVFSDRGRVTSRIMQPHPECETQLEFGTHWDKKLFEVPADYMRHMIGKMDKTSEWRHTFHSELVRRRIVEGQIKSEVAA